MMRIASFNINGVKARLPRLLEWQDEDKADIVALQEIKSIDDNFPREEFIDKGWHLETYGQKGFNGVALLSKFPISDVMRGLPGDPDDPQARYIEAMVNNVRVTSIYLPNGNPQPGPKFDYKLAWMDRLIAHAKDLLAQEVPVVLSGDFNVIPEDQDCHDPKNWLDDALFQPESQSKLRQLIFLGYADALRTLKPRGHDFTFWDYQAGAWQKDHGIRIDHHLLSPQALDRLESCEVDRAARGREKSSDHTPIIVTLRD